MQEDETVSYRMSILDHTLNYKGQGQEGAKFVFERLTWLWKRMVDEKQARKSQQVFLPSKRQAVEGASTSTTDEV
jgi:hypothetical protein